MANMVLLTSTTERDKVRPDRRREFLMTQKKCITQLPIIIQNGFSFTMSGITNGMKTLGGLFLREMESFIY